MTAPPPAKRSKAGGARGRGRGGRGGRAAAAPAGDGSATTSSSGGGASPSGSGSGATSSGYTSSGSEKEGDRGGGSKSDAEDVVVDFEFFDPRESDYLGAKTLLAQWLDGAEFDSSSLASATVAQTRVGTVLKTGPADDPIGLLTVLDMARSTADVPALGQLLEHVAARAGSDDAAARVRALATTPHTGVLVSERLVNVPPALAPPLASALFDEVAWATEDEPTDALRASFRFERYLVWSRAFVDVAEGLTGDAAAAAAATATPRPEDHARPEDGFLAAAADWTVHFPLESRQARPGEPVPVRVFACVPARAVAGVRAALDAALGGAAGAGS
jgi:protein BCP1